MSNATDDVILRAEGLTKIYEDGQVRALDDVSLEIRRGEYVAIIGKSGSGKSTLLSLLGGLDTPTSGTVYFDGQPLNVFGNLDRFRSEKLGFIFQSFYLLVNLTALENVQVPMFETRRAPAERVARAKQLLELVGLGHRMHHLPQQLSVGERQRVAIARSLANDPPLLMADEPTGNLDTNNAKAVFELFDRLHREQGRTIILITHDPNFARLAERIIHVRDGRVTSEERSARTEELTLDRLAT